MWSLLSARVRVPGANLHAAPLADWLWRWLSLAFPEALAAVVMPTHIHLVVRADPDAAARLRRILARFAGLHFGMRGCWDPVDEGDLHDLGKLARGVRYTVLNPCRDGLVADPLEWVWSTHRDVMGCAVAPWVTAEHLASELRQPLQGFESRHHEYVSGDPSVRVAGTALPLLAPTTLNAIYPLADIAGAAAAANRASLHDVQRRGMTRALFVHLAYDQGWTNRRCLAMSTATCPQTISRLAHRELPTRALDAGKRCLGDSRLRAYQRA